MIVHATAKEVPTLCRLVNSGYRGESSKQGWTTEADLLDGIRIDEATLFEMIEKGNAVILIEKVDDRIEGCVYLEQQGDSVYLGMLTVSPSLQGRGTGKSLLAAATAHAKDIGCSRIIMTVISVRTELIAWYNRHGYVDTGIRKPFPMDDPKFGLPKQMLEFIEMEKVLN